MPAVVMQYLKAADALLLRGWNWFVGHEYLVEVFVWPYGFEIGVVLYRLCEYCIAVKAIQYEKVFVGSTILKRKLKAHVYVYLPCDDVSGIIDMVSVCTWEMRRCHVFFFSFLVDRLYCLTWLR